MSCVYGVSTSRTAHAIWMQWAKLGVATPGPRDGPASDNGRFACGMALKAVRPAKADIDQISPNSIFSYLP